MKITAGFIMKHRPCYRYPERRVRDLVGAGKTPLQVLASRIPAADKVWVLLLPGVLSHAESVKFAVSCARRALSRAGDADVWMNAVLDAEAWLTSKSAADATRVRRRLMEWRRRRPPTTTQATTVVVCMVNSVVATSPQKVALAVQDAATIERMAFHYFAKPQVTDLRKIIKARGKR